MDKPHITLFFIEAKRGLSFLPRLLAGAILLAMVLAGIGFFMSHSLYQNQEQKAKATVAVYLPEDDRTAVWMLSILEEMDSVKDYIIFERKETEEDAVASIEKGAASGAVIIPENFVAGILDSTNTPARIILPKGSALTSKVVKELTKAGADTLGAAQAGIYSVNQLYKETGREEIIPVAERELNKIYLGFVFPRNDLFFHKTMVATGVLSTAEYFTVAAVVFFIFLWGMGCAGIFSDNRAYRDKLRIYGVTTYGYTGIRIGVIFLLLLCTSAALAAAAAVFVPSIPPIRGLILPYLVCLWVASCYTVLLYAIGKDGISGAMLLFLVAVGMVFCAGGFVPSVFLPESIQRFGAALPAASCIEILSAGISGEITVQAVSRCLLMGGALYAAAVAVTERRRKAVGR